MTSAGAEAGAEAGAGAEAADAEVTTSLLTTGREGSGNAAEPDTGCGGGLPGGGAGGAMTGRRY